MDTTDPLREAVSGLREALDKVLAALPTRLCGAVNGWVAEPAFICNLPAGHTGNHKDTHPTSGGSVSWPNRTAAERYAEVVEMLDRWLLAAYGRPQ